MGKKRVEWVTLINEGAYGRLLSIPLQELCHPSETTRDFKIKQEWIGINSDKEHQSRHYQTVYISYFPNSSVNIEACSDR